MTATAGRQAVREAARQVRVRRWPRLVGLAAVFVCAACGLAYEVALIALGSYLIGDTVGQAAIVLGVMVFAMGVGVLAARPLQARAAAAFAVVEVALAVLGGLSVIGLYAAFAWLDLYGPALIAVAFVLGALIGAQIPLLMTLLRENAPDRREVITAEHVGALLGGLAVPFLLMPVFGQLRGALVIGGLNAAAGLTLVFTLFRGRMSQGARIGVTAASVVTVMLLGYVYSVANDFEVTARQQLYRDPVVHAERSRYQEIVLTRSLSDNPPDLRLYLNGDLQFSSVDEYRFHEALVHPALSGPHERVLIVGGGDGLALREVLRYKDVSSVTVVERDPAMVRLARTDDRLRTLNGRSFDDQRVRLVEADPFEWLRDNSAGFDAVIVDLPDPDQTALAKLYSTEFYALLRPSLAPGARLAVQAGSPFYAPRSFWCVEATLRAAGFATTPYHADVPSFGDWGFVLAATGAVPPNLLLADRHPELKFLDRDVLEAAGVFPPDRDRIPVEPSTLLNPRILEYARGEWRGY